MSDQNNDGGAGPSKFGEDSTKRGIEEVGGVPETSQAKKVKIDDEPDEVMKTLREIDSTYVHFTNVIQDIKNTRAEFNQRFLKFKERLEKGGVLKEQPRNPDENN